jgi:xanthine dehydrogenase accessory factor
MGDEEALKQAGRWLAAGEPVAAATVLATWGSAPRPVGSLLVVNGRGEFAGSVSGGCIEGSVIHQAGLVLAEGEPRFLRYGVTNEIAWEVGLPCGGSVELYLEPLRRRPWERLGALQSAGLPVARLVDLVTGLNTLVTAETVEGGFGLEPAELAEIRRRLHSGRSGVLSPGEDGRLLVQVFAQPLRLLVVGAVHITQVLAPMAALAGWQVTVIDPRGRFASAERFPGLALSPDWPDEALARLAPDARTAVVVLSHDPKLDDPALAAALRSPAFYIGALGSRRNQARRLARLGGEGFAPEALARIRGPVGLAIGAETPAEIAIAILAEITATLRRSEPWS